MSQEPFKFLSHGSGSVKGRALQYEVDKMCMVGGRGVIDLSSLNGLVICTKFNMGDGGVGLRVNQEGRHYVPDRPQGHLLPDSHSSGFLALSPECTTNSRPCYLVFLQLPSYSGLRIVSSKGNSAPSLSR